MDMEETLTKYLENCYRYLAIRNRSEKEIRDYLVKKKADLETIEVIVEKLKAQLFLDDENFARLWIRQRARIKPKGKWLLQMELRQKGIAEEIIKRALDDVAEELPDEITQAKQLIDKRIQRLVGQPRQEIYAKVGAFLARRGFGWEIAKRAIDDVLASK